MTIDEEASIKRLVAFAFTVSTALGFAISWAFAFLDPEVPDFVKQRLLAGLSPPTANALAEPVYATIATAAVLLVPLCLYLLFTPLWGWRSSPLRLPEAQDSFYFIGFLLTLIGLFFSSLKLASGLSASSSRDVTTIFLQNIVALFSTIIGLLIRNVLSYTLTIIKKDPLREMDDVLTRIDASMQRILQNTREFGVAFEASSDGISQRSPTWEAHTKAVGSLLEQVSALSKLSSSLAEAQKSIKSSADDSVAAVTAQTNAINELTPILRSRIATISQESQKVSESMNNIVRQAEIATRRQS